jgi:hypothetical protein
VGAAPTGGPASTSASAVAASPRAVTDADFGAIFRALSEKGGHFPSDNYVSNELSFLNVDQAVTAPGRRGGAYVGVGPEQSFTYVGRLQPSIAFVVDIRRENALLHLVYKVLFETSTGRADFAARLCSRSVEGAPGADATVEQIVAFVDRSPVQKDAENALAKQVLARREALGVPGEAGDEKAIREAIRAFAKDGASIRYKMEGSSRRYPSLGELAAQTNDAGQRVSFLADEEVFRSVQRLSRENRLVPVVGNLAGDKTFPAMSKVLAQRGEHVSMVYTSNVEQYVFAPADWKAWRANLAALPLSADALLVRVYFDQGKPHPQQRRGQRTASLAHDARRFLERAEKPGYKSWFDVTTDEALRAR